MNSLLTLTVLGRRRLPHPLNNLSLGYPPKHLERHHLLHPCLLTNFGLLRLF